MSVSTFTVRKLHFLLELPWFSCAVIPELSTTWIQQNGGFMGFFQVSYQFVFTFTSFFFILQCCLLLDSPPSPTPLQDDMRLERRRCIQVILFSRVFRREIFDVLDVLFVSIPYSAPPKLCCSNLSRIFKNLQNFKILLCPLKLFCNCPGRRWFP